jgi:hypothetical protein
MCKKSGRIGKWNRKNAPRVIMGVYHTGNMSAMKLYCFFCNFVVWKKPYQTRGFYFLWVRRKRVRLRVQPGMSMRQCCIWWKLVECRKRYSQSPLSKLLIKPKYKQLCIARSNTTKGTEYLKSLKLLPFNHLSNCKTWELKNAWNIESEETNTDN